MAGKAKTLWTFAITSIALFMVVLDNLVVSTALPVIRVTNSLCKKRVSVVLAAAREQILGPAETRVAHVHRCQNVDQHALGEEPRDAGA